MMRQSVRRDVGAQVAGPGEVLRALREAAGITQDGWAARLGYGRRTVQRWERGDGVPDAAATEALVRLCRDVRLVRPFTTGILAGITPSPDWLRDFLADARQIRFAGADMPLPRRDNFPAELTSFVGREDDVAQVARRLATSRLVTLTGPGGVGKTRLALRAAAGLAPDRDGAWLVELAPVTDGAHVALAVATAIGLPARPGRPWPAALREAIAGRPVLLVVDNCEHLLDGCAALAADLLGACPVLTILATSRAALGLPGEALWPVAPLTVPGEDDAPESLARTDAVRLFVDRARAAQPDFALLPANAAAVAQICRRLDGLPLAIELAAARVRVLTTAEIAARLDDRLLAASRAAPRRHHTLHAAIAWSVDLLDDADQGLFARLSVFPGSFTLAAAEAVCAGDGESVLAGLARLVDRSLVVAEPAELDGETVYRLLETIRRFAADLQAARGEPVAARYAAWVLAFAQTANAACHGPEQRRWFHAVVRHRADVLAAMQWGNDHGDAAYAVRLAGAICWPWGALGWGVESAALLERALAVPDAASHPHARALALAEQAAVSLFLGRYDVARDSLADIAASGEQDAAIRVSVLATEARLFLLADDMARSEAVARRGLDAARRGGDHWHEGRFLAFLALAAVRRGQRDEADAFLMESIALARATEDDWSLATALVELGDVARAGGEGERAAACYRESLAVRRRLGVPGATASLWHNLGYVGLARHAFDEAADCFAKAEDEFRRWGDQRGIAECVIGLGAVAAGRGERDHAVRVIAAGVASLESLGSAIWPSNQADLDAALARCRAGLSPEAFAAAWGTGRAMSLENAWALATSPGHAGRSPGSSQNEAKTSRGLGSGASVAR